MLVKNVIVSKKALDNLLDLPFYFYAPNKDFFRVEVNVYNAIKKSFSKNLILGLDLGLKNNLNVLLPMFMDISSQKFACLDISKYSSYLLSDSFKTLGVTNLLNSAAEADAYSFKRLAFTNPNDYFPIFYGDLVLNKLYNASYEYDDFSFDLQAYHNKFNRVIERNCNDIDTFISFYNSNWDNPFNSNVTDFTWEINLKRSLNLVNSFGRTFSFYVFSSDGVAISSMGYRDKFIFMLSLYKRIFLNGMSAFFNMNYYNKSFYLSIVFTYQNLLNDFFFNNISLLKNFTFQSSIFQNNTNISKNLVNILTKDYKFAFQKLLLFKSFLYSIFVKFKFNLNVNLALKFYFYKALVNFIKVLKPINNSSFSNIAKVFLIENISNETQFSSILNIYNSKFTRFGERPYNMVENFAVLPRQLGILFRTKNAFKTWETAKGLFSKFMFLGGVNSKSKTYSQYGDFLNIFAPLIHNVFRKNFIFNNLLDKKSTLLNHKFFIYKCCFVAKHLSFSIFKSWYKRNNQFFFKFFDKKNFILNVFRYYTSLSNRSILNIAKRRIRKVKMFKGFIRRYKYNLFKKKKLLNSGGFFGNKFNYYFKYSFFKKMNKNNYKAKFDYIYNKRLLHENFNLNLKWPFFEKKERLAWNWFNGWSPNYFRHELKLRNSPIQFRSSLAENGRLPELDKNKSFNIKALLEPSMNFDSNLDKAIRINKLNKKFEVIKLRKNNKFLKLSDFYRFKKIKKSLKVEKIRKIPTYQQRQRAMENALISHLSSRDYSLTAPFRAYKLDRDKGIKKGGFLSGSTLLKNSTIQAIRRLKKKNPLNDLFTKKLSNNNYYKNAQKKSPYNKFNNKPYRKFNNRWNNSKGGHNKPYNKLNNRWNNSKGVNNKPYNKSISRWNNSKGGNLKNENNKFYNKDNNKPYYISQSSPVRTYPFRPSFKPNNNGIFGIRSNSFRGANIIIKRHIFSFHDYDNYDILKTMFIVFSESFSVNMKIALFRAFFIRYNYINKFLFEGWRLYSSLFYYGCCLHFGGLYPFIKSEFSLPITLDWQRWVDSPIIVSGTRSSFLVKDFRIFASYEVLYGVFSDRINIEYLFEKTVYIIPFSCYILKIDYLHFLGMQYQVEYIRVFKYNEYIDNNLYLRKRVALRRLLHRRYSDIDRRVSNKLLFNFVKNLYFRKTYVYRSFGLIITHKKPLIKILTDYQPVYNINYNFNDFIYTRSTFFKFFSFFRYNKRYYYFFKRFFFVYIIPYFYTVAYESFSKYRSLFCYINRDIWGFISLRNTFGYRKFWFEEKPWKYHPDLIYWGEYLWLKKTQISIPTLQTRNFLFYDLWKQIEYTNSFTFDHLFISDHYNIKRGYLWYKVQALVFIFYFSKLFFNQYRNYSNCTRGKMVRILRRFSGSGIFYRLNRWGVKRSSRLLTKYERLMTMLRKKFFNYMIFEKYEYPQYNLFENMLEFKSTIDYILWHIFNYNYRNDIFFRNLNFELFLDKIMVDKVIEDFRFYTYRNFENLYDYTNSISDFNFKRNTFNFYYIFICLRDLFLKTYFALLKCMVFLSWDFVLFLIRIIEFRNTRSKFLQWYYFNNYCHHMLLNKDNYIYIDIR